MAVLSSLDRTGLSASTSQHYLIDAGAVYTFNETQMETPDDWVKMGATSGGNEFNIEQEVRIIEVDGIPGQAKGTRRVIEVVPQIVINLIEINETSLKMALPGADFEDWPESEPSHHKITRSRNIELADYIDYMALVGEISADSPEGERGEPAVFIIENALSVEDISLPTEDEEESVLELTFTGHFDMPEDDGTVRDPFTILYPQLSHLDTSVSGTTDVDGNTVTFTVNGSEDFNEIVLDDGTTEDVSYATGTITLTLEDKTYNDSDIETLLLSVSEVDTATVEGQSEQKGRIEWLDTVALS